MVGIWKRRFVRAWLVIAIPAALGFSYLAYQEHDRANSNGTYAEYWQAMADRERQQGTPKGTFSINPSEAMADARRRESDARDERDGYLLVVLALLLIAPAGLVLSAVGR